LFQVSSDRNSIPIQNRTRASKNSCSQSAKELYPAVMSTTHELLCTLRQPRNQIYYQCFFQLRWIRT